MKTSLWVLLLLEVLPLLYCAKQNKLPHVILIVADDLGWNDVSFHGSQQIPTPNIDALAYSGVILNNYYVQPICTPTRSALLTGRHPIHTGLQHGVVLRAEPYGLGLNETLLSQYLKRMGYATHAVGKWHLGFFAKEYTPTFRGFDSHFGYWDGSEDYWDHTVHLVYEGKEYIGVDFHDGLQTVRDEAGHYSTEIFTTRAQKIIQQHNASQPLFLYLPHQATHSSDSGRAELQAPLRYIEKFPYIKDPNRRFFAAMAAAMDESIGNVTKSLHEKGMLDNSIIIFTTDNGGPTDGYDSNMACNLPLRGRKYSLWEGGTRGAGFLWSPLLKKASEVSNQMMQVTDWLPTILAAVGYNTSSLPKNLDGVDMWGALNNPSAESPRKELLYNIDPVTRIYAIRMGNYKYIHEFEGPGWYPCPGISSSRKEIEKCTWEYGTSKQEYADGVMNMNKNSKKEDVCNEHAPTHMFKSSLYSIFQEMGMTIKDSKPVVVECGPKPANASTNCNPKIAPCLFDLSSDPCEYNNIASSKPDIVKQLQQRLDAYNATAVPIRNRPNDPRGLPIYHHNAWEVWVDL